MDIEEFMMALAKARYVQELEENIVLSAIYKIFCK